MNNISSNLSLTRMNEDNISVRPASTMARTYLDHVASLDIDQPTSAIRNTSIICTLGKIWVFGVCLIFGC